MAANRGQMENTRATEVAGLNNRLDAIGWALLLILTGLVWIAPKALVPEGAWLLGLGLILLGVNVARSLNAIPVQGFGIWLGILALALGAVRSGRFDPGTGASTCQSSQSR